MKTTALIVVGLVWASAGRLVTLIENPISANIYDTFNLVFLFVAVMTLLIFAIDTD